MKRHFTCFGHLHRPYYLRLVQPILQGHLVLNKFSDCLIFFLEARRGFSTAPTGPRLQTFRNGIIAPTGPGGSKIGLKTEN